MFRASLKISPQEVLTEIYVGKGLLQASFWIDLIQPLAHRFALITDGQVEGLKGTCVKNKLIQSGIDAYLFSFPEGERQKTREIKHSLEDQMLASGFSRDSAVIAVGGGTVSDIAGFVAATYCRGIPFIIIPTTLLSMVDASLGGKVGVNTKQGKNLIGAFYHPHYIFMDTDLLATLSHRELLNGMAEIIKYALILSPRLMERLQKGLSKWEVVNQDSLLELICECSDLKRQIIERDPSEKSLRRILNFGHTFGHAIEVVSNFHIPHGEAISIGMIAEAYLSYRLGFLRQEQVREILDLMTAYGFSLCLLQEIEEKRLIEAMSIDKKADQSQPRFVLLEDIGRAKTFEGNYCTSVDPLIVRETVAWMFTQLRNER